MTDFLHTQATGEDVEYLYQMLLTRAAENAEIVEYHLRDRPTRRILADRFLRSAEFLARARPRIFPEKWVCAEIFGNTRRIWLDLGDTLVSNACLLDAFEPAETQFIRDTVHKGWRAMDIGANIGWHAIALADCVGENGQVLAIEASKSVADRLMMSVAENGLSDRVSVVHAAVWDTETVLGLVGELCDTNRGHRWTEPLGASAPLEKVPAYCLDALAPRETIQFIKIDIEGGEFRALSGATNLLARCRPIILSEMYPAQLAKVSQIGPDEFLARMSEFGYTCHILRPDGTLQEKELTKFSGPTDRPSTLVFEPNK